MKTSKIYFENNESTENTKYLKSVYTIPNDLQLVHFSLSSNQIYDEELNSSQFIQITSGTGELIIEYLESHEKFDLKPNTHFIIPKNVKFTITCLEPLTGIIVFDKPQFPSDYVQTTISASMKGLSVPVVAQCTNYTCGVASALSIVIYYEKLAEKPTCKSEEEAKSIIKPTRKYGSSPGSIVKYFHANNIGARIVWRASLDYLCKNYIEKGRPVMVGYQKPSKGYPLEWKDGHWAVLTKITPTTVTVMDPSYGRRVTINRETFERRWYDYLVGPNSKRYQIAIVTSKQYRKG